MDKQKKICFRITRRRVIGAVLLVASVLNLIIVGAAFEVTFPEAAPTATASPALDIITMTIGAPTATEGSPPPIILTPTDTPTQTATITPPPTYTFTATLPYTFTPTDTPTPTATVCTPYYWWPVYFVQGGDTLYSIALKTDSRVEELIRANCLSSTIIFVGQSLYVPRLPVATATATPTYPDTPTVFQDPNACVDPQTKAIAFSVMAYDPEGVSSLNASYRINRSQIQSQVSLGADGNTYYGSDSPPDQQTLYSIYYSFTATDNLGFVTTSNEYSAVLQPCYYYTVR